MPKHRCPCCHFLTLDERSGDEICQVCRWQDDGQDDPHADEVWGGPNHALSLTQARENFLAYGASDVRWLNRVRKPRADERRE